MKMSLASGVPLELGPVGRPRLPPVGHGHRSLDTEQAGRPSKAFVKPVKGLWASSDERRLSASGFDYREKARRSLGLDPSSGSAFLGQSRLLVGQEARCGGQAGSRASTKPSNSVSLLTPRNSMVAKRHVRLL